MLTAKPLIILSSLILVLDIIAAYLASMRFSPNSAVFVRESAGRRRKEPLMFNEEFSYPVRGASLIFRKKDIENGFFKKVSVKLKKAGFKNQGAVFIYLLIKYPLAIIMAVFTCLINYPYFLPGIAVLVIFQVIPEIVIQKNRKAINMKFQRYIYKIYKYLYNQVSSGVKVTDAVKTVYEVVDDKHLKNMFIRMAARYELTLDIDTALEEFRENFDVYEAEMLCTALKQGIETGDNSELLARQEDIMFKKYFNYIQSETDSCKNRSLAAVSMFTVIIVLMIIIPLIRDMSYAAGRIFIN